jgi:hypothetical protein
MLSSFVGVGLSSLGVAGRGFLTVMCSLQANFMLSSEIKHFLYTVTFKPLPKGWLKAVDLGCAGRLPATGEIKGSRGTPLYMVSPII